MTYAETAQHGHYVTVRFNSRRWAILAGPFVHRRDAEHHIDPARRAAQAATARTARSIDYTFAEYGTARLHFNPGAPLPRGRFNDAIGLDVDPTSGYLSSAPAPTAARSANANGTSSGNA